MTANAPDLIPDTFVSVAGLTHYIRSLLEEDHELRQVWVSGEVSSAKNHRSGIFFTLQDPEASAAIKCVVWTRQLAKLTQIPTYGEQLIVLGSIKLYPAKGEYQLTVWQSLPAGEGLQALRYQQMRNRLQAEGLFDAQRKKDLPTHPQIIAVITSPTAAAWGDIQRTIGQRDPGLQVLFSPATVQGEQAPDSIVKAVKRVEKDGRAEVIIIARGGGAVEELACFNDERVVRAIAMCKIPIVTGIGHQRDESLADLAADVAVHTPTAAAELVVRAIAELYTQHQQRISALTKAVNYRCEFAGNQLQNLRNKLRRSRLDKQIQSEIQSLLSQRQQLLQVTTGQLKHTTQHLELLRQKLATLDPLAVLQRGYAVVRKENRAIARNASQLNQGDKLLIQLGQGEVKVEVISSPQTTPIIETDEGETPQTR